LDTAFIYFTVQLTILVIKIHNMLLLPTLSYSLHALGLLGLLGLLSNRPPVTDVPQTILTPQPQQPLTHNAITDSISSRAILKLPPLVSGILLTLLDLRPMMTNSSDWSMSKQLTLPQL
jgi:hypothetical protein